jgi:hypothetical protein
MTDDDVGAILDHVQCDDCDLRAYRTPVDGPPDPDRHGNRRWRIKCVNPACDNRGSMLQPKHGGIQPPRGFSLIDD